MDLTNYVQSGYGAIMIETTEIKRAVRSITCNGSFTIGYWNMSDGFYTESPIFRKKIDPVGLIEYAAKLKQHVIIAENFEQFLDDGTVCQTLLNQYGEFKSNQVCFVIIGASSRKIPIILKQCIAILDFELPGREEISKVATALSTQFKKAIDDAHNVKKITDDEFKKSDFSVTPEVVDSCLALSMEELENALAYSGRTERKFNPHVIIERKRKMLRNTGFLDFIEPEPIENLGGMDEFKSFIQNRLEPFHNPKSIKPKLRSILLVGVQGCIAGSTNILIKRGERKTGRTYSIEDAYYSFNNIKRKGIGTGHNQWWNQSIPSYAHCFIGGDLGVSLGWNKINNIVYSGIKRTLTLTTESGKNIRATEDHPFLTPNEEYVNLNDLYVGNLIVCKDDHALRNHFGNKSKKRRIIYSIPHHPFAHDHIINGANYKRLSYAHILYEAFLNGVSLDTFVGYLRKDPDCYKKFKFLLPGIVIHHDDGDCSNDSIDNYKLMSKEEHDTFHQQEMHSFGVNKSAIPEKIISIEEFGYEKVYDIQMDAPHHNFVANGIVVHNCGKSLATKILCSIFNWPGIVFDIGATKGQYLGQTGENLRLGTKIIDALGRTIVVMDEIEKGVEQTEFGGGKQSGGGAIADMIGHMLTWMQERKSEAIVAATSNNLNALPPEFLRAGRWDRIFFVGLPNPYEIQIIIKIMNRKWKSELPIDLEFCKTLYKNRWSGAEIEQLSKDSHYDDIESCIRKIPILAIYRQKEIDKIIEDGKKYSPASIEFSEIQPVKRKISVH